MSDDYLSNPGFDPNLGSLPDEPNRPVSVQPSGGESAPPPPSSGGCIICSATPARFFDYKSQFGWLFARTIEDRGGTYCQSCSLSIGRTTQNKTMAFGWFGFIAFFTNFITIFQNGQALVAAKSFTSPSPANQKTKDPGRSVFLRLGIIGPFAIVGVIGYLVVDGRLNPTERLEAVAVGQCADLPSEGEEVDRLTVRPCDEPHEAEVFASGGQLNQGRTSVEYCLDRFELYTGADVFDTQLDIFYFEPDGSRDNDPIICLLARLDGGLLTESQAQSQ